MASTEIESLRRLYCALMGEVGARLGVLAHIIRGEFKLPPGVALELSHLQFRMICELIALCCLAAHGDIPATSSGRMRSAYAADWIVNALEKLHARFYPIPAHCVTSPIGEVRIIKKTYGYFTKRDLIKMYTRSAEKLHRGTLKTIGPRTSTAADWAQIQESSRSIYRLVEEHVIELSNPYQSLWVVLEDPKDGRCHAYDLEAKPVRA